MKKSEGKLGLIFFRIVKDLFRPVKLFKTLKLKILQYYVLHFCFEKTDEDLLRISKPLPRLFNTSLGLIQTTWGYKNLKKSKIKKSCEYQNFSGRLLIKHEVESWIIVTRYFSNKFISSKKKGFEAEKKNTW